MADSNFSFSYSHAFALSVCGVVCGLITAMDLGESTDPADKNAGWLTLWSVFILIFILLIRYMFRLKYNSSSSSFLFNLIPAGLSVAIGIIIYYAYFFQNNDLSAQYYTSLGLMVMNLILIFKIVHGFENPEKGKNGPEISASTKGLIVLSILSLATSFGLNISLESVIDNNSDVHPASKSMFKWINIVSISICVLFIFAVGMHAYFSRKQNAASAAAAGGADAAGAQQKKAPLLPEITRPK
jgi:hypothetical protein